MAVTSHTTSDPHQVRDVAPWGSAAKNSSSISDIICIILPYIYNTCWLMIIHYNHTRLYWESCCFEIDWFSGFVLEPYRTYISDQYASFLYNKINWIPSMNWICLLFYWIWFLIKIMTFFYRLTCLNYGFGDIFKKTLTLKLMVAFFVISLKQSIKSYKILFAHYILYKITNLF